MRSHDKRESGAALLVAVLLLAIMGVIALASMDTAMQERQIAGFNSRANISLYASEAGVSAAMGIVRQSAQGLAGGGEGALLAFNPAFPGLGATPPTNLGDPLPYGQPSFRMDPNASDPDNPMNPAQAVRYIGKGKKCDGWVMSEEEGATDWSYALWDVRVQGDAPGGANTRIQATATNCHPYD